MTIREDELLLRDEVYRIVGAAMEVLNEVGHGLHEKPYENALGVELELLRISYSQQTRFPVFYKGVQIHEYVPAGPHRVWLGGCRREGDRSDH